MNGNNEKKAHSGLLLMLVGIACIFCELLYIKSHEGNNNMLAVNIMIMIFAAAVTVLGVVRTIREIKEKKNK